MKWLPVIVALVVVSTVILFYLWPSSDTGLQVGSADYQISQRGWMDKMKKPGITRFVVKDDSGAE